MNKEHVAFYGASEIQDMWEPTVGDSVYLNGSCITSAAIYISRDGGVVELRLVGTCSLIFAKFNDLIYIPHIEDVLGWLRKHTYLQLHYCDTWTVTKEFSSMPVMYDYTALGVLIQAYMHLEHSKTWDGEKWGVAG